MPINATLRYFKITTSLKLYYQHWIPQNPKALLIYVHDLGDHVGRHGNFVKYFAERGYAVSLYDQRGHGQTGGDLGNDGHFREFVNDLSSFVHFSRNSVPKGTPLFLVGHGVGAQFIINLLVPGVNSFNAGIVAPPGKIHGFITISAYIKPLLNNFQWKERFEEKIARIYPSWTVKSLIDPWQLSANKELCTAYSEDPLVIQKIPIRLQKEILDNTQIIMAMASRIRMPALMLHGLEDQIAAAEGTKDFFSRLPFSSNNLNVYEEGSHELLNGETKDLVFTDMESWLESIPKINQQKETICDLPLFTA
ncbi:MAG: alpha/beta hydrolase [Pseudomonadota bacterium]